MILLWDTDPASAARYRMVLGDDVQVLEGGSGAQRAVSEDPRVTEVVIGPGVDAGAACVLAEWLRVERPGAGVVLVRTRLDVTVLSQALRSGIREVVATDDLTGLAEAVARSRDLGERMGGVLGAPGASGGRVVTVFSAKGGVGKTTVATNVGAHLASTGSRVLLIDLDLASGDVAISLQLLPELTMADVVAMGANLDEQALRSVVTPHACGLHVLAAPPDPTVAERVTDASVAEVLRVARQGYDYVIVDTPPSFTEHVLAACDASDLVLLVATLDIPAVKSLRLALETLDLLGHPRESRLVVLNRSDLKVGLHPSDVVAAVKQEIAVSVPNSLDVTAALNRGVPIVLDAPRHPVSVALRDLAERCVRGRLAPDPAPAGLAGSGPAGTRPRRGRWGRR